MCTQCFDPLASLFVSFRWSVKRSLRFLVESFYRTIAQQLFPTCFLCSSGIQAERTALLHIQVNGKWVSFCQSVGVTAAPSLMWRRVHTLYIFMLQVDFLTFYAHNNRNCVLDCCNTQTEDWSCSAVKTFSRWLNTKFIFIIKKYMNYNEHVNYNTSKCVCVSNTEHQGAWCWDSTIRKRVCDCRGWEVLGGTTQRCWLGEWLWRDDDIIN